MQEDRSEDSGGMELVSRALDTSDLVPLFERCLKGVRDDLADNPYLEEALRVLPVGGFRSAIGSFWNAVVDDLRSKILHRGVTLFGKAVDVTQPLTCYEDFQDHVNDDQLIVAGVRSRFVGFFSRELLFGNSGDGNSGGTVLNSQPSVSVSSFSQDVGKGRSR